eukprot:960629_1
MMRFGACVIDVIVYVATANETKKPWNGCGEGPVRCKANYTLNLYGKIALLTTQKLLKEVKVKPKMSNIQNKKNEHSKTKNTNIPKQKIRTFQNKKHEHSKT